MLEVTSTNWRYELFWAGVINVVSEISVGRPKNCDSIQYSVGIWGCLPRRQVARGVTLPTDLDLAEVKNQWSNTSASLYDFKACRGSCSLTSANLKLVA